MQNRHDKHEELSVEEYLDTVAEHAGMESKIKTILTTAQAEFKDEFLARMAEAQSPIERIMIGMEVQQELQARVVAEAATAVDTEILDNIHHVLRDHSGDAKAELAGRRLEATVVLNSMFRQRAEKAAAEANLSSEEDMSFSPGTPRC